MPAQSEILNCQQTTKLSAPGDYFQITTMYRHAIFGGFVTSSPQRQNGASSDLWGGPRMLSGTPAPLSQQNLGGVVHVPFCAKTPTGTLENMTQKKDTAHPVLCSVFPADNKQPHSRELAMVLAMSIILEPTPIGRSGSSVPASCFRFHDPSLDLS